MKYDSPCVQGTYRCGSDVTHSIICSQQNAAHLPLRASSVPGSRQLLYIIALWARFRCDVLPVLHSLQGQRSQGWPRPCVGTQLALALAGGWSSSCQCLRLTWHALAGNLGRKAHEWHMHAACGGCGNRLCELTEGATCNPAHWHSRVSHTERSAVQTGANSAATLMRLRAWSNHEGMQASHNTPHTHHHRLSHLTPT